MAERKTAKKHKGKPLGYGLLPLPEDNRDFQLGAVFGQVSLEEIPQTDWLVAKPLKIKNQKETDFCTGYALTSVSEDQEGLELSPEYQFAKTKQIRGEYQSWGADLRSAAKSAVEFGSLKALEAPYSVEKGDGRDKIANWKNWPLKSDFKAKSHKKKAYFRADVGSYDIFDNLRAALWQFRSEKRTLVTGCLWNSNWENTNGGIIPKQANASKGFGHAFKLLGQKMIENESYLVAQNSYGKEVGDKGLFYFPREVVNREFTFGSFMFQDVEPETIKKIIKSQEQTIMANSTKSYLSSQTIQGMLKLAIPFLAMILTFFGVEITSEEAQSISDYLTEMLVVVAGLWGIFDVIIGRKKANNNLKGLI